jgi:hypothetical protein
VTFRLAAVLGAARWQRAAPRTAAKRVPRIRMSQWFRVFGLSGATVEPAALLEHLHGQGFPVAGRFGGDDRGWFRTELVFADDTPPVVVERYFADEAGIRAELNTWAAWLEEQEDNPYHLPLMERLIGTAQLFTLHQPAEDVEDGDDRELVERLCLSCSRYLAASTDGVYQADHGGFFAADGTLLVPE